MTATREKSYGQCAFQGQANHVVLFTATEGGWFPPVEISGGAPEPGSCIGSPALPRAVGPCANYLTFGASISLPI